MVSPFAAAFPSNAITVPIPLVQYKVAAKAHDFIPYGDPEKEGIMTKCNGSGRGKALEEEARRNSSTCQGEDAKCQFSFFPTPSHSHRVYPVIATALES